MQQCRYRAPPGRDTGRHLSLDKAAQQTENRNFHWNARISTRRTQIDYIDIKYALQRKGYTLTKVALELGLYGPQSVQQVCARIYRSRRVEAHVAAILGLPVTDVFPDHGVRKRRVRPAKYS